MNTVELALAPIDALRGRMLAAVPKRAMRAVRSRAARLSWLATASVVVSTLLVGASPMALFIYGPLVLGVPHLVADVRHLVLRPGHHRARGFLLLVGAPLLLGQVSGHRAVAFAAITGAAIVSRAPKRILARALAASAFGALAYTFSPRIADATLLHGHNLVALVWLVSWRSADRALVRALTFPLMAAAIVTAGIFFGAFDATFSASAGAWLSRNVDVAGLAGAYAPSVDARHAERWLVFFAFAQSIHYAVWLRLIPEVDREIEGTYSFRQSAQKLARDVPRGVLAFAACGAVFFMTWGAVRPIAAREAYLTVGTFHAYLELAMFAFRPRAPTTS